MVFPLRGPIPRHNRCRNQSLGLGLEVEFEMDIRRQIGMIESVVGSSVGMIESVGKNGMIEMMAKVCQRFGIVIVVVVDIGFVGMLAFVEDDNLLVRKG